MKKASFCNNSTTNFFSFIISFVSVIFLIILTQSIENVSGQQTCREKAANFLFCLKERGNYGTNSKSSERRTIQDIIEGIESCFLECSGYRDAVRSVRGLDDGEGTQNSESRLSKAVRKCTEDTKKTVERSINRCMDRKGYVGFALDESMEWNAESQPQNKIQRDQMIAQNLDVLLSWLDNDEYCTVKEKDKVFRCLRDNEQQLFGDEPCRSILGKKLEQFGRETSECNAYSTCWHRYFDPDLDCVDRLEEVPSDLCQCAEDVREQMEDDRSQSEPLKCVEYDLGDEMVKDIGRSSIRRRLDRAMQQSLTAYCHPLLPVIRSTSNQRIEILRGQRRISYANGVIRVKGFPPNPCNRRQQSSLSSTTSTFVASSMFPTLLTASNNNNNNFGPPIISSTNNNNNNNNNGGFSVSSGGPNYPPFFNGAPQRPPFNPFFLG